MFTPYRGLTHGPDDGGAGAGGTGTPAPSASGGTPPPASGTPPPASGVPPSAVGAPAAGSAFNWTSLNLAPELQAVVDRHQFPDPGMVLKSYDSLEKLHGFPPERIIKLPAANDPPEMWKDVHKKLGVPDNAIDYKLPVPQGDTGEFAREAEKWMHEAHVPQGAASKIAEKWNAHVATLKEKAATAAAATHAQEMNELKTEWAAQYESNVALVDRAAEEFGMTKAQLDGLRTSMGPKAAFKFMHEIGSKLGSEGKFVDNDTERKGFNVNMSPESAQAEMTRLRNDKAFREQFSSQDPVVRSEARARMNRLEILSAPGTVTMPGPGR